MDPSLGRSSAVERPAGRQSHVGRLVTCSRWDENAGKDLAIPSRMSNAAWWKAFYSNQIAMKSQSLICVLLKFARSPSMLV
jgi:hypothetical protein